MIYESTQYNIHEQCSLYNQPVYLFILQVVRCQLLSQPVDKLIENRTAENSGLVTDYQVSLKLSKIMILMGAERSLIKS